MKSTRDRPPALEDEMTDQQPSPRDSRLAEQPVFRPVGPLPQVGPRPSFDELTRQTDGRDFQPLAAHLDDDARDALGLPAAPQPVTVDRELADRIRGYFFDHPAQIAQLPDSIRDLINL